MAKKSKSTTQKTARKPKCATPSEVTQDTKKVDARQETQEKFEERYKLFMGQLSEACEQHGVATAIAIVNDPAVDGEGAIVFARGHIYEQSKLLSRLLGEYKMKMAEELQS